MSINNLLLVGMMGSGKSAVARILAKRIKWVVLDTDEAIGAQVGMSVQEIFKVQGEAAFRAAETALLEALCSQSIRHHVIATGGGMPAVSVNQTRLKQLGYVVYLASPASTLMARLRASRGRPKLSADPAERSGQIALLLEERDPVYRAVADWVLETAGLSPEQIADMIEKKVAI